MDNVQDTIISQYANSPIITQLIDFFNQDEDPQMNFDNFYSFVWNVETAQGFGLDIWGRIVGISRYLPISKSQQFFGFYNSYYPSDNQAFAAFNRRQFFSRYSATPTIPVDDATYRRMIIAKAYANLSIPTAQTFNVIFVILLGPNAGFVIDEGDMHISYFFNITITAIQYAIIYQTDILPVPAGVGVGSLRGKTFGFKSAHLPNPAQNFPWPFNVGVFA